MTDNPTPASEKPATPAQKPVKPASEPIPTATARQETPAGETLLGKPTVESVDKSKETPTVTKQAESTTNAVVPTRAKDTDGNVELNSTDGSADKPLDNASEQRDDVANYTTTESDNSGVVVSDPGDPNAVPNKDNFANSQTNSSNAANDIPADNVPAGLNQEQLPVHEGTVAVDAPAPAADSPEQFRDRVKTVMTRNSIANSADLEFPTDVWGFTSRLKTEIKQAASRLYGTPEKFELLMLTMYAGLAHIKAKQDDIVARQEAEAKPVVLANQ